MKVRGINVVIFIDVEGTDTLYACARSATLNLTTDFIETSGSGSGTFATFLPTKNSFTGTLEGVVSLEEPSMLTLADLKSRQINQQVLSMKFQRTDDGGNLYTSQADFYIANSSDTGSFNDMDTFSIDLRGTGPLVEDTQAAMPPGSNRILKEFLGSILTETGDFIITET